MDMLYHEKTQESFLWWLKCIKILSYAYEVSIVEERWYKDFQQHGDEHIDKRFIFMYILSKSWAMFKYTNHLFG